MAKGRWVRPVTAVGNQPVTSYEEAPQARCMRGCVCGMSLCPWLTPHAAPPFLILDGITLALIPQALSVWVATEGCRQCISYLLSSWEASFIYMLMFTRATRLAGILWRAGMRQILSHRELPAPPPDHTIFPLLITWRWKARPELVFLRASVDVLHFFLDLSLPSVHPGPREEEERGGGKLWLILLWRQPKGEEHSGCDRNHHKRGLLGGVSGGVGVQVMFQEEGLPWRELLVHLLSW